MASPCHCTAQSAFRRKKWTLRSPKVGSWGSAFERDVRFERYFFSIW
jgi:hypothetical protein